MLAYRCPVCAAYLPDRQRRIDHECRTVSEQLVLRAAQKTVPSFELLHADLGQARNGLVFSARR